MVKRKKFIFIFLCYVVKRFGVKRYQLLGLRKNEEKEAKTTDFPPVAYHFYHCPTRFNVHLAFSLFNLCN